MLQEQMKVLNDVEENLFIADKDDIIEGAPIDMKIDVDGEFDRWRIRQFFRYNRLTVWKGKAKIDILD